MNIFVTGATGFVGKALLKRLDCEHWHARKAILDEGQADQMFSMVETVGFPRLSPTSDFSDCLYGIDVIVHLAARVHVMDEDATDPLTEFRKVNVAGTERLARQAAASGVRRLVFLSSVKVHGEETDVSYLESNTLSPEDPYGVSKKEAEDVLRRVAAETNLEVVIIRPPLVYGPGVKANFRRLLEAVWRGIPLPLASLRNKRSLIYLGNLVDVIVLCATHPQAAGNSYLVSDGEDVSTPELVRMIATAFGRSSRLFPVPVPFMRLAGKMTGMGAVVDRLTGSLTVDTTKIKRELGWNPPYSMAQGLTETAEWFRNKS